MTQICVTLAEETTAALIDRMVDIDADADLFEIRGDLVLDLDLLTLLRARSKPLLFTCRAVSEGGKAEDAHAERKEMLLEAVKRGFDYVDVEYRARSSTWWWRRRATAWSSPTTTSRARPTTSTGSTPRCARGAPTS